MAPELIALTAIFAFFLLLELCFTNLLNKKGQIKGDGLFEILSSGTLIFLTQPLILATSAGLASYVIPQWQGVLSDWSFWSVFLLFLVFDDMSQYWWHRLSHTVPWLYKLHRPHHNAEYLSIRVVYRNNFFYYLLMPGIWFSGVLIFMGGAWVYTFYLVLKMTVIFAAHSDVRWDEPLYKIDRLSSFMWLVERTISTPATHSAHHGKHADDGVTNYKGNYGNLLFFWDVLFGTAKITRRYPSKIGVENLPPTTISEQMFWPIVRAPESK